MTIKEVSEQYDISADTLRYYERIGLLPPVPRRPNGIRNFDAESCGWVEFIKCMRNAGVQIEALIEYIKLFHQKNTAEARRAILVEQRARLLEQMQTLQTTVDRLSRKIENYETVLIPAEQKLRQAQLAGDNQKETALA